MIFNSLYQSFNSAISRISTNVQFTAVISRDRLRKSNPFQLTLRIKYPKFWAFKWPTMSFWPTISIQAPYLRILTIGNIPEIEQEVAKIIETPVEVSNVNFLSANDTSNITPTDKLLDFHDNGMNNLTSRVDTHKTMYNISTHCLNPKQYANEQYLNYKNGINSSKQEPLNSSKTHKYVSTKNNSAKFQNKKSSKEEICPNDFNYIHDLIFSSSCYNEKNRRTTSDNDMAHNEKTQNFIDPYDSILGISVKDLELDKYTESNELSIIPLNKTIDVPNIEKECINIDVTNFVIFLVFLLFSGIIFYSIKWITKLFHTLRNPKMICDDNEQVIFSSKTKTLPRVSQKEHLHGVFDKSNSEKYRTMDLLNIDANRATSKIYADISNRLKINSKEEKSSIGNFQQTPPLVECSNVRSENNNSTIGENKQKFVTAEDDFLLKKIDLCEDNWSSEISEYRELEFLKDVSVPISATSTDCSVSYVSVTSDDPVTESLQSSCNFNSESAKLSKQVCIEANDCDNSCNYSLNLPEDISFNLVDSENTDDEEKIRNSTARISVSSSCDLVEKTISEISNMQDNNHIDENLNYDDFLFESKDDEKLLPISKDFSLLNRLQDSNSSNILHSRQFEQNISQNNSQLPYKEDGTNNKIPDSSQILKSINDLSNIIRAKMPKKQSKTESVPFINWSLSRRPSSDANINVSRNININNSKSDKENNNNNSSPTFMSTSNFSRSNNKTIEVKQNQDQAMENNNCSNRAKTKDIEKLYKTLEEHSIKNFIVSDSRELKSQCDLILDDYSKEISESIIKVIEYKHLADFEKEEIVADLNSINKLVLDIDVIYSESDSHLHHEKLELSEQHYSHVFQAYSNRFKILFVQIESDSADVYCQLTSIESQIN